MSATKVFVARLIGCSVFDPVGDRIGKVRDVLVVYRRADPPHVVGLIVEVSGKRRIFVSIGRINSIAAGQVIISGPVNVRRFEQRGGEVRVIAEMLGRKVLIKREHTRATIEDVAIEDRGQGEWEVSQLFLRKPKTTPSPFGKGPTTFASWNEVTEDELPGEAQSAEHVIAAYSDMLPADLASTLLDLPDERRLEVAEELPDDRLADVLEEMPDQERVDILSRFKESRAADVLNQMQPDDAADLLAQLPGERSEALLQLMEPEEAQDVRMLLEYEADTAGGLMTTEPVIVSADATVAEGLALIRRHELAPALGAAVCVTLPPYEPPTGRFLGIVHFQRMLRYPPNERLGTLIDQQTEPVQVNASAAEVTRVMATYNLVSVPVVDAAHRLLGVVTVDDVLDHVLPNDWRSQEDPSEQSTLGRPGQRARTHGKHPLVSPGRRRTDGTTGSNQ